MIRHVCMFKLVEDNKQENIKQALILFEPLKTLPMAVKAEIVTNSELAPTSNYDICLIVDFETIDDLNAYQVHPSHVEFGKFITGVRTDRACVDYEF